jgi:hypothetical protein
MATPVKRARERRDFVMFNIIRDKKINESERLQSRDTDFKGVFRTTACFVPDAHKAASPAHDFRRYFTKA